MCGKGRKMSNELQAHKWAFKKRENGFYQVYMETNTIECIKTCSLTVKPVKSIFNKLWCWKICIVIRMFTIANVTPFLAMGSSQYKIS